MAGSITVLSHTADTGIEVRADSLAELCCLAAQGMFSLMYGEPGAPQRHVSLHVESTATPELLVDALSDLLYLSEAEDVVPCTFQVEVVSPTRLQLTVGLAQTEPEMLVGPPIKAVTYHDLAVTEQPDGTWFARIFFDV